MARDWRTDPEGNDEPDEAPIDMKSAIRSAKTATALGRAPAPAATTKIGAFDLEQALARSRRSVPPASPEEVEPEASGRPTMPIITDAPGDAGPDDVAPEAPPPQVATAPMPFQPVPAPVPAPAPEPPAPAPKRRLGVVIALIVIVVAALFVAAMLSQR